MSDPSDLSSTNPKLDIGIKWVKAFLLYIGLPAVGLVLLYFILSQISGEHTILPSLGRIEVARGLITFLIAIATVLIMLFLTGSAIFAGDEYEKRIIVGKEILGTMIPILGTIVGFYFGSTVVAQEGAQALITSPIVISNEQPKVGDTITIMSLVAGGTPPYSYSIIFNPPNIIEDIETNTSTDGVIQQTIPISSSISSDTDVTFQIDVEDSTGSTATIESRKITVTSQ